MSASSRTLALVLTVASLAACGDDRKSSGTTDAPAKKPAAATKEGGAAASAGGAYDKAKGTATLKGVIKYVGTIPKQVMVNKGSEPKCHGESPLEKTEVNSGSTLPHAFIYLVSGPSAGLSGYTAPVVEMDQDGCVYQPHVAGAMVDQVVTFKNTDSMSHNVHVKSRRISPEFNKSQSAGQVDEWKPNAKEFGVKIICDIHSWMNSYMHIMDNPFFATSARETGAFEIKGLYPGKHTFKVWHENWAPKDKELTFEIDLKDGENVHDADVQGDK